MVGGSGGEKKESRARERERRRESRVEFVGRLRDEETKREGCNLYEG